MTSLRASLFYQDTPYTYLSSRTILLIPRFCTGVFSISLLIFGLLSLSEKNSGYQSYRNIMQHLILTADVPPILPSVAGITLISLLFIMIVFVRAHHIKNRQFLLTATACACFLVLMYVTLTTFRTINESILTWQLTPVSQWQAIRNQWNDLNLLRTCLSVASYLLLCMASASSPIASAQEGGMRHVTF